MLARNLERAQRELPFREGLFAPFLAAVERSRTGPLLTMEALRGSAFELKVNALQTVRARNQRAGSDIALRVV